MAIRSQRPAPLEICPTTNKTVVHVRLGTLWNLGRFRGAACHAQFSLAFFTRPSHCRTTRPSALVLRLRTEFSARSIRYPTGSAAKRANTLRLRRDAHANRPRASIQSRTEFDEDRIDDAVAHGAASAGAALFTRSGSRRSMQTKLRRSATVRGASCVQRITNSVCDCGDDECR